MLTTRWLSPALALMRHLTLPAKLLLLGGLFAGGAAALAAAWGGALAPAAGQWLGGTGALLLASWLYLAVGFCEGFIGGLRRALRLMERIEQGRLDQLPEPAGSDEIAQLGRSLRRMTAGLSGLVAEVRTSSALVAQAGNQLARGYRDLSARTEQQAASLQQTAASVTQLASTVQENAHHAADADRRAGEVCGIAEQGAEAMRQAVGTVGAIQADTDRMSDMVAVIDGIALQTNLLALNAAIEAARAGEQGRGFAVVAGEVRRLARRCSDESRKIRALIDASAANVHGGVERIRSAGGGIGDVVAGVRHVAESMSRISSASAGQSSGLSEIASAVNHLDTITQQNAHLVEEAANQATYLHERAAALSGSVAHFRLMQGTAGEALAMVERAARDRAGREADALARWLTDPASGFHDRDMYVFALDRQGVYRAFGGKPEKVGSRVQDLPGVDGAGLLAAIVRQADAEAGWVEYRITNPLTGELQDKMSYVMRLGELYVGCGVYKSMALSKAA
jgi:methyl-accepting chemotaxis protein